MDRFDISPFVARKASTVAGRRRRRLAGVKPGDHAYKWVICRAGRMVWDCSKKYPRRSRLTPTHRPWREVYLAQEVIIDAEPALEHVDVAIDVAILMVRSVLARYKRAPKTYPDREAVLATLSDDLARLQTDLAEGAPPERIRWAALDLCWDEP